MRAAVAQYRTAMREFAQMRALDVWYARLDLPEIARRFGGQATPDQTARIQGIVQQALRKNNVRAVRKLTHRVNGELRIAPDPPLVQPVEDVFRPRSSGSSKRACGTPDRLPRHAAR